MIERLKVLHYNVGKRRQVQWSLLNDEALRGHDALAVVEPYIQPLSDIGKPEVGQHHNWQAITPTTYRNDGHVRHKFRAILWINKSTHTQQVPVDSYDVAATLINTAEGPVLLVAAYDLHIADTTQERDLAITTKLQAIQAAIALANSMTKEKVEVVVCSDFNRHYPVWGGFAATRDGSRQNEAECIITFA